MASEIREILVEIEKLEQLQTISRDISRQTEILRKFGLIQWIWGIKKKLLSRQEDKQWINDITNQFVKAIDQLQKMKIPPSPRAPVNIQLPSPPDPPEAIVAKATVPSILLQLEAIYPLLMQNEAMEPPLHPPDILALCKIHPYVPSFVNRYFDQYHCTDLDTYRPWRLYPITLQEFAESVQLSPVPVPVQLIHLDWHDMQVLRQVGDRIVDCELCLPAQYFQGRRPMPIKAEKMVAMAAACLRLMPNLKCLSINTFGGTATLHPNDFRTSDELPALPQLKTLRIIEDSEFIHMLQKELIRKYASTLEAYCDEKGSMDVRYGLNYLFPAPGGPLCLKGLALHMHPAELLEGIGKIGKWPLERFYLRTWIQPHESHFQFILLMTTLHATFGDTLEEIKFCFGRNEEPEVIERELWIFGMCFPKLKRLEMEGYMPPDGGAFLLMFPALEELVFDEEDVAGRNTKCFVNLYPDVRGMLRSNVWKLFPRLEKVVVKSAGILKFRMGRTDCLKGEEKREREENLGATVEKIRIGD